MFKSIMLLLTALFLFFIWTGTKAPQVSVGYPTPVPTWTATPATPQPGQPAPQPTAAPGQPTPAPSGNVASELDSFLGSGNWKTFPDRKDAVKVVNWPQGKKIDGPIGDVDKDGVKYSSGQTPNGTGPATAWLKQPLP